MTGVFIRKKKTVRSRFLSLSSRDTGRSWQSTGQKNAFITHQPGLHFYLGLQIWRTKIVLLSCPTYAILLQMLLQSNIPTSLWPPGFVCFTCSNCSYLLSCSPPISSNSVSYTYFPFTIKFSVNVIWFHLSLIL